MTRTADETRIAWRVLETAVRIDTANARVAGLVGSLLLAFPEVEPDRVSAEHTSTLVPSAQGLELGQNGRTLLVSSSRGAIVLDLLTLINRLVVRSYSGLAIHAGAVAAGDRVITFPGATGEEVDFDGGLCDNGTRLRFRRGAMR